MEILLNQGEGDSFWVLGDLYTFKVAGKQTYGAFTVIDQIVQPQNGPPPHIHHGKMKSFMCLRAGSQINGPNDIMTVLFQIIIECGKQFLTYDVIYCTSQTLYKYAIKIE